MLQIFAIVPALIKDCFGDCFGSSHYDRYSEIAVSNVLSLNCRSYVDQSRELRSVFASAELSRLPVVGGHTHGVSASMRSSASAFIDTLAPSLGKRVVYIQGSSADQRKGRVYTRHYRWGKDLNVAPSQVTKRDDDITAMIDVDYHVDMPRHLARNFKPLILYTLQPSKAGSCNGEYKYCFNDQGDVRYLVSGGGEYSHKLWNWKGDSVSASRYFCCIPITYSVFAIERKQVDDDHQIILVAPLSKFRGVYSWFAMYRADAPRLKLLNPVDGEFIRIMSNGPSGMTVSTSRVGGFLSCNVNVNVDEAIASAANTTAKITHATLKAKMAQETGDDFTGSEVLLEYHLRGCPRTERVDVVNYVRQVQWVKSYQEYEPEKPAMVSFMNPIVDGAFVPDSCYNNDIRMVEERLNKLKSSPQPITPFLDGCIQDFVKQFCVFTGTLEPVSNEVVYERQSKPTQRHILDAAQHGMPNGKTSSFQKNEAYLDINDPRIISTINGVDKMEYSAYIYAVSDVLKVFSWYAFGKKPKEVAYQVASICDNAESHVDLSDFSRMDGRVNELARYLEKVLMLSLFNKRYHLALIKLMNSQTCLRGRTKHGVTYDSGYSRASGSPETSAFNTILNAFIAYLSFRMTRRNGRYMKHIEAWNGLGIYGGDDGLTSDIDGKAAEKAAGMMGQKLTVDRVVRGHPGVTFLSRHYGPDVWFGSPNSCCDILRQVSKFHVTVRLNSKITPEIKLREKAFAFHLTDSNTPLIGEFVRRALDLFPLKPRNFKNHLNIWAVELDSNFQYPNTSESWMIDLLVKQLPEFNITEFRSWLKTTTHTTIFEMPDFGVRPSPIKKVGVVTVDGNFVADPVKTVNPVPPKSQHAKSSSEPVHYRARTKNAFKGHKTSQQRN